MTNLELFRGDTLPFEVSVFDTDNQPYDLTGAEATFTAKRSLDSSALITKTVGDGLTIEAPNLIKGKLIPNDTVALTDEPLLYWDVEVQKAGDVFTVDSGRLRVKADVTRGG